MILRVKSLTGRYRTFGEMMAVPGMADSVRGWAYASARYDGLSESDADDAAQELVIKAYRLAANAAERKLEIDPVRILFSSRAYMRRSNWQGFTGQRRSRSRKLPAPVDDINRTMRGSSVDNPAMLAMAVESATRLTSLACGRNARWLRSLSADDVRAMLCPSVQDGTPAVVADPVPVDMTPRPATPDDGTGHRPMSEFWTKKIFPGIPYHTAD